MNYEERIKELLKYKPHLKIIDNKLYIEDIPVEEISKEYGTPCFVYSKGRIVQNYNRFLNAFKKLYKNVEIRYAMKANSNPHILKLLLNLNSGIDAVSVNEIKLALSVGFKPEKIIYTGVNRTEEELEFAVKNNILINIDSLSELKKVIKICEKNNLEADISFRFNPEIDVKTHKHIATGLKESKFGLHEREAYIAYKIAREYKFLKIRGIHMHIGSQITSVEPFEKASKKLLEFAGKITRELNINLDIIDFGGGLGIKYKADQNIITPEDLARCLINNFLEASEKYGFENVKILLEPGRYIVGDSSILITEVTTIKITPYKKFIGVNAGFNILIRPVLYEAYHEVIVANRVFSNSYEKYDVVGYLCESGDILAKDRILPKVFEGDLLAFLDTGAYCSIMSSNYNLRERAVEVMVECEKSWEIRRRETFEDIVRYFNI